MTASIPTYTQRVLGDFARQEWPKALAYLRKQFSLTEDDCKDVFQEAFITLHRQNLEGRLDGLAASLSTYFISVCCNKALERLRSNRRNVPVDDELSMTLMGGGMRKEKIDQLLLTFDDEPSLNERKDTLVRQIVNSLPSPCNELLWGFYRDGLSMAALAQIYHYSMGSVKVVKHRCCEKFRKRYTELKDSLF